MSISGISTTMSTKKPLPDVQNTAMKESTFWSIIQKVHDEGAYGILGKEYRDNKDYSVAGLIDTLLSRRGLKSIIQFEIRLRVLMWKQRPLSLITSIKKILGDKYNNETEIQFILWLISEGKEVYQDAFRNPKSVAKKYKYRYNLFEGDAMRVCTLLVFNRKSGERIDNFIDEQEARMKYDFSYAFSHLNLL